MMAPISPTTIASQALYRKHPAEEMRESLNQNSKSKDQSKLPVTDTSAPKIPFMTSITSNRPSFLNKENSRENIPPPKLANIVMTAARAL